MTETVKEERMLRALRSIVDHGPEDTPSFDPYRVVKRIALLALVDVGDREWPKNEEAGCRCETSLPNLRRTSCVRCGRALRDGD